ncbi:MAG: hypothetical protein ACTIJY_05790 [Luteimonas sp.]
MKVHRPADQRGHTTHGARTRLCTFSSGDYHDAAWMGFGVLRQLNEEQLPPGASVPTQRVANMELLTFVLDGMLVRDGVVLETGALAWTGAGHASDTPGETAGDAGARVLRIALQPDRVNLQPAGGVSRLAAEATGVWTLLASPDATDALPVRQQAWLRHARLAPGGRVALVIEASQRHWLHVLRGAINIEGSVLDAGDALGWQAEAVTTAIVATDAGAELLLFTLPG